MTMLFPPSGIAYLLFKPVLQQSHRQSKPNIAFVTQMGTQLLTLARWRT